MKNKIRPIKNFITRGHAYKALEEVENFEYFGMYLSGFITEEEKETLGKTLTEISDRLYKNIKKFEENL